VFWVLAGDVFVPGFEFTQAAAVNRFAAGGKLAHLWLVPNPAHNPKGDFGLGPDGLALNLPKDSAEPKFTYSTIGLYRREFFDSHAFRQPAGPQSPTGAAVARGDGQWPGQRRAVRPGAWTDVGTPARLDELNQTTTTTNEQPKSAAHHEHHHDLPETPCRRGPRAEGGRRRHRPAAHRARIPAQPRQRLSLPARQLLLLPDRL
jgi:hypothetical protein